MPSLASQGIKRIVGPPLADIETSKNYCPAAVCALGVVAEKYGLQVGGLFLPLTVPDWLVSGYRYKSTNPEIKNSAHAWGDAFDIKVGDIDRQVQMVKLAVMDMKLFNRGGLYIGSNTCHIDQRNDAWMKKYYGKKFWVGEKGRYISFDKFLDAVNYALHRAKLKEG
jgi:hypothetical protein